MFLDDDPPVPPQKPPESAPTPRERQRREEPALAVLQEILAKGGYKAALRQLYLDQIRAMNAQREGALDVLRRLLALADSDEADTGAKWYAVLDDAEMVVAAADRREARRPKRCTCPGPAGQPHVAGCPAVVAAEASMSPTPGNPTRESETTVDSDAPAPRPIGSALRYLPGLRREVCKVGLMLGVDLLHGKAEELLDAIDRHLAAQSHVKELLP